MAAKYELQEVMNQPQDCENGNTIFSFELSPVITNRQKEVLEHIAEGNSTEEIADRLCLSVDTIETHRRNIIKKLKVKNMAHALAHAFRNNLMQ